MNYQQGSPEWLEMRKNYIGASDAPVVMNMSPWKKKIDLWREKVVLPSHQKTTGPMLYGKETESIALEKFNIEMGLDGEFFQFEPTLRFHPAIPYMMASLDGFCEQLHEAVEIKCPGKKDHELASKGEIPKKYIPQLQHQIEVCGLAYIWYYSYSSESQYRINVPRDQKFIDEMLEKEAEFWDCVVNFREPD